MRSLRNEQPSRIVKMPRETEMEAEFRMLPSVHCIKSDNSLNH